MCYIYTNCYIDQYYSIGFHYINASNFAENYLQVFVCTIVGKWMCGVMKVVFSQGNFGMKEEIGLSDIKIVSVWKYSRI